MGRARPGPFAAGLAYTLLLVTPLGLALAEHRPGDGFAVNAAIALGFVALAVLGLQTALGTHLPGMTRRYGTDGVRRFHREITLLAVVAALGHPAVLLAVEPERSQLLDVVSAPLRTQLAWLSVTALVLLVATSLWRGALRLSYPVWHVLHSVLSATVVVAAMG